MTAASRAGAVLFGALAIAACTINPAPAHADDIAGVTAVWFAPGTNQWPADGQTLKASTSSTALDLAFVQSTADALGCGYTIQGDQYADDATTAALLATGKLYAAGTSAESWPNGQYLPEYSTVLYTGDCVAVVAPAPTETPAPVTPRTDAVVEQVAAKTAAPELAATGFDNPWLFPGALALIVGGILLIRAPFRAVQKKRESK